MVCHGKALFINHGIMIKLFGVLYCNITEFGVVVDHLNPQCEGDPPPTQTK